MDGATKALSSRAPNVTDTGGIGLMSTVLDARVNCQLQPRLATASLRRRGGGPLRCKQMMKMAIESPITAQAPKRTTSEKQLRKVDSTKMRPAEGLFFVAPGAGKLRIGHGSSLPKRLDRSINGK